MQLWLLVSISCATFIYGCNAQSATACAGARDEGMPCSGRSGSPVQKFYYDSRMGVCQPFMYKGCNGNDNRFDTAERCRASCASGTGGSVAASNGNTTGVCPGGATPFMVVKGVPAMCRSVRDCMNGYGCSKGACCPNKAAICNLKYDAGKFGTGGKMTPKFYYNAEFKACMLFTYFGYEGNANNFDAYNDCVDFCL